ncbi:hypothetical protein D3C86_907950 [compost metagenome]
MLEVTVLAGKIDNELIIYQVYPSCSIIMYIVIRGKADIRLLKIVIAIVDHYIQLAGKKIAHLLFNGTEVLFQLFSNIPGQVGAGPVIMVYFETGGFVILPVEIFPLNPVLTK